MNAMIIRSLILLSVFHLGACTNYMFQPLKKHYLSPDKIGLDYDDVYLRLEDGIELHGWHLSSNGGSRGVILFFHGSGENISTHLANVYWLVDHGYEVYTFDYRGYGKSGGVPDLEAIVADNEDILRYVAARLEQGQKFIVMGHSLGASLAIYSVAVSEAKPKIDLFIAIEAFTDYQRITREVLSKSWLTWLLQYPVALSMDNRFRPIDFIAEINPVEVLVMHSRRDQIIDFSHGEELYRAARQPKHFEELDSDHNHIFNTEENRRLLIRHLKRFW